MFQGQSIQVLPIAEAGAQGLVELRFDRQGDAINKLDARTTDEFRQAIDAIAAAPGVRGVLVTSAKDVFIVGADITEFGTRFQQSPQQIAADVHESNAMANRFEDLGIPSVVAINGFALGGGLEVALLGALRVMSETAQVGVPEVKLGLFPGLAGTVRLVRVAGLATAFEWVAGGRPAKAAQALAAGVVDEVVAPGALRDRALALLQSAVRGEVDWAARQRKKREALPLSPAAVADALATALATVVADARRGAPHQPAAQIALEMMAEGASLPRDRAIDLESAAFGRVAKTQAAASLVRAFLNDQAVKKLHRRHAREGRPVAQAAVLGAGTMGGGIAFTSALRGVPVRMKDIAQPALDQGLAEADKQLARQVKNGRLKPEKAQAVRASITAQLDEAGFDQLDCVIEAIVENLEVKRRVLAALEGSTRPDTVIASNTSSLRIDDIAQPLARPENFVGMHFFNPVPVMPLVEVIRGSRTSPQAVSTAVAYAAAMGKVPIVVQDGPGFLVNRVLTPYVNAFVQLVADGADFEQVDRAMEAFGWPMGPAYLQDVVGMDVGAHVFDVIAAGYPERIRPIERNAIRTLVAAGRFGQKTGGGFYDYQSDPAGKPRKASSPAARALVATLQAGGARDVSDAEIVERMMLPMLVEAAHALEEGVVATPAELDTAMLLGIGFPAYAGGPLQYADWLGLPQVVALCEKYAAFGPQYQPTARMRAMAAQGSRYHSL
ncbi:fatty acid oxidation complex subunit alpha FadB [Pseudorhodoferax sp. Leaf274]|uniref:fatty acid oxidation complex subunit alpha FadB n=1 Tax=Pseudorhodoferax sp. Leaf274 TaxID=1736318 RepID=UPI000702ED8F|nr:fatty acid oxidation complex subunit alpha FadB [Pseudorhodoferax sp. Leaf274]KQP39841.1 multifunctional fatty acid oxidation complex subunit alpha [Pseudorhodoferax sp. Leaf274]